MGLIRDTLGSALGSNQVNNGFSGGPRLPFVNNNNGRATGSPSPTSWRQSTSSSHGYGTYADNKNSYPPDEMQGRMGRYPESRGPSYDYGMQSPRQDYPGRGDSQYQSVDRSDQLQQSYDGYRDQYSPPPDYEPSMYGRRSMKQGQSYDDRSDRDLGNIKDIGRSKNGRFRPLALPQIAYGDGEPFLRGYSYELGQYGISPEEFIPIVDAINVAIIPSPENQIFQKGANIAGWFLPGAASIGLVVGQIGVGIGSAVGHSALLSRTLSEANIKLFVPNGLEICIGKTTDVDAEVGIASASGRSNSSYGLSPEERQGYYGALIAHSSLVLPPLQQNGRSDPIAMLGRGLASRGSQKKMQKAEKDIAKGKTKDMDSLEGGLKWLIVRRASPDALAYWKNTMQQSNTAFEQEQASTSRSGYSRQ